MTDGGMDGTTLVRVEFQRTGSHRGYSLGGATGLKRSIPNIHFLEQRS